MVISFDELKNNKSESIKRSLERAERLIDAELQCNSERLNKGLWVMIPCTMPYEQYTPLLDRYKKEGWVVTHEKINAFGRLYFSKGKKNG